MPRAIVLTSLVTATMLVSACTTDPFTGERKLANTAGGAAIGAATGAALGAIIGGSNRRKAAIIGAGVGALAGGAVGGYMDAQEAKLRRQLQGTGVSVTRDGDNITLNMPSNITFATSSSTLSPDFEAVLDSVALVLEEYNKTYVDVTGHTDSTGSDAYNLSLSERRAQAVGTALVNRKVLTERLVVRGFGESYPIADNGTPQGRAANRRVEITLLPVT